jgi:hypothetical protein
MFTQRIWGRLVSGRIVWFVSVGGNLSRVDSHKSHGFTIERNITQLQQRKWLRRKPHEGWAKNQTTQKAFGENNRKQGQGPPFYFHHWGLECPEK